MKIAALWRNLHNDQVSKPCRYENGVWTIGGVPMRVADEEEWKDFWRFAALVRAREAGIEHDYCLEGQTNDADWSVSLLVTEQQDR